MYSVEDFNNYTFDQDKEKTLEGKFEKFADNATRYFTKQTNKEIFAYRNIMEYQDGGYVLTNRIICDENNTKDRDKIRINKSFS